MFNSVYSYGRDHYEALNYCKLNELYFYNKNYKKKHFNSRINDKLQYKTYIYFIETHDKLDDKKLPMYLYTVLNYKEIKKTRKLTDYEFKALNILLNFYGEDTLHEIIDVINKNECNVCVCFKINDIDKLKELRNSEKLEDCKESDNESNKELYLYKFLY